MPPNPLPSPAGTVVSSGETARFQDTRLFDERGEMFDRANEGGGRGGAGAGGGGGGLMLRLFVGGKKVLEFAPVPEIDQDASPLMFGGCNCTAGMSSLRPHTLVA